MIGRKNTLSNKSINAGVNRRAVEMIADEEMRKLVRMLAGRRIPISASGIVRARPLTLSAERDEQRAERAARVLAAMESEGLLVSEERNGERVYRAA